MQRRPRSEPSASGDDAPIPDEFTDPRLVAIYDAVDWYADDAQPGFTVERMYGDWDRRPVDATARELIVVAAR